MIAVGDSSDWWFSAYYAVAFVAAFVVAVFTCVCNPKSKRFHKHKSFMLPHDLPNEVPLNADLSTAQCSSLQAQSCEIDSCCKQLKAISLHRALPDIPQVPGTSSGQVDAAPFSNSTSFADVLSNDDVDSLYTVANSNAIVNSQNHPYARIRNHVPVDSSTENDTDDYSESRVPTVAAVQCHHHENIQFRVVNNNNEPNNAYELGPQPHILRLHLQNNIEPQLFANSETEEKKEISYNTISVREPLSKVLAERENIEHHYNEVEEEERVSSFYEEITTGSATYSKINEVSLNNNKPGYGEPIASTSRHFHHNDDVRNANSGPSNGSPLVETNGPLYSFVDKKMKRANLQASTSAQPPPEANNLYTMVVKSPAKSSTSVVDSKLPILQRYSPPPPLPPPLHRDTQPKLYRNTIMFGTPSNSGGINQHYNTISDELEPQQNIYHKISRADSEKDPGYETVDRNEKVDSNQNDHGYEAIMMDESDPAYEIVKPDSSTSDDNNPAYETIKNETYRQEELLDPNYEIIATTSAQVIRPTVHLATHPGGSDNHHYDHHQHLHQHRLRRVNSSCSFDESEIIEHL